MKTFLSDLTFKSILPKTKEQFDRQFDVIFGELEKLNLEKYYICETGCIRSLTQFDWQGNFTILANNILANDISAKYISANNISANGISSNDISSNYISSK